MKRLAIFSILTLATILLFGASQPPAKEVGPLFSLSGSYSHVSKPRVEVIGDAARWDATWKEHMGGAIEKSALARDVIPYVDFSRCMVVAMFSGDSSNGSGWHLVSTQERDGHTVIRYDHLGFQTEGTASKTSAYGFAVVERSSLPLILELNTQTLIDPKPIWKEQQRLPALPKPTTTPGPRSAR